MSNNKWPGLQKGALVLVTWIDSSTHSGWNFTANINPNLQACWSVGWVFERTKKTLVLVSHYADIGTHTEQVNSDMIIPLVALTHCEIITKAAGDTPARTTVD